MKSLLKIVLLLLVATTFLACPSDDNGPQVTPARPYEEVYLEDLPKIEEFLQTHYVTIDSDYNTEFFEIPEGGTQTAIWDMPELIRNYEVTFHDITYKLYYLNLREGIGESPTRVDSSFVSYKGNLISDVSITFDESITPVWFPLEDVVRGWGEIIPKFKTGTNVVNSDGTITFNDYGAGVMFLPSGLGYFNTATGNIPSYSPLIFNFKLYNLRYRDHDRDEILSKYEYRAEDDNFNLEADDTDGDDIPDYLDGDDDGDGRLTKYEIEISSGVYYDFVNIPTCSGGGNGKKKHLDPFCRF
ncbi:FKBP-type peptidylprolyl isomerase [Flavobacterium sp. LMO8]|uniref:FKBP-type peptidyl-prolyl cis-trans isomerase n=1 Tax=Flavobacterium sp. LMO8 TaxID=2654244 RepID=UPI001291164F|nr:FKBP-type peptidylprolyl isomerase [Flavobacterium sp. LMO8]MQP23533.1 FKBP-type peptidylprolyl isomerase [Flavobacterium sp. LMO8]